MYKDFAANLCHNLIADGFYIASEQKEITSFTPVVVLMKNQSPVLYVVNIVNADIFLAGFFERQLAQMNEEVENNLKNMYCSSCVNVNILATEKLVKENKGYCDEKPMVTCEKINSVWWTADLNEKSLYAGAEQPSKIIGIENKIEAAFKGEVFEENAKVEDIEKQAVPKSNLPVISKNISMTLALIFFNAFIFMFVHYSGNEDKFLQQFACNGDMIWNMGEIYRLFTAMFFHVDWGHVFFNCFSIYILVSRAEIYLGKKNTAAVYFISGLGAAVVSSIFSDAYSVGASGAICGVMGALLVLAKIENKDVGELSYFTMLIYALAVLGYGMLGTGIDNYAHFGGFIVGVIVQLVVINVSKNKKQLKN